MGFGHVLCHPASLQPSGSRPGTQRPWLQACRGWWRRDGVRLSVFSLSSPGALLRPGSPASRTGEPSAPRRCRPRADTSRRDRRPAGVPGGSGLWLLGPCLRLGFLGAGSSLGTLRSVRASGGVCAACAWGTAAHLCPAKAPRSRREKCRETPGGDSARAPPGAAGPRGPRRSELVSR